MNLKLIFLFGLFFVSLNAKGNYPWTLQPCYEVRARWLVPVDIENDGVSEIIECVGPYAYVKDQNGFIREQINFTSENFSQLKYII